MVVHIRDLDGDGADEWCISADLASKNRIVLLFRIEEDVFFYIGAGILSDVLQ